LLFSLYPLIYLSILDIYLINVNIIVKLKNKKRDNFDIFDRVEYNKKINNESKMMRKKILYKLYIIYFINFE